MHHYAASHSFKNIAGTNLAFVDATGLAVTGAIEATKSLLVTDVYAITAVSTAAQTRTLDLANGAVQTITTNDNFTMDFTGPAGKAGFLTLYTHNSAASNKTIASGTGVYGTFSTGLPATGTGAYVYFWDGTRMARGSFLGDASGDLRPT